MSLYHYIGQDAETNYGSLVGMLASCEEEGRLAHLVRDYWMADTAWTEDAIENGYQVLPDPDTANYFAEAGVQISKDPSALASALQSRHYQDPPAAVTWLKALATDTSYYDGSLIKECYGPTGYIDFLQNALEYGTLSTGDTGFYAFANQWSGAWPLIQNLTQNAPIPTMNYWANPGAYMLSVATATGSTAFLDTAVAAVPGISAWSFAKKIGAAASIPLSTLLDMDYASSGHWVTVLKSHRHHLAEHHLYGSARLGIKGYWASELFDAWDGTNNMMDTGRLSARGP